MFNLKGVKLNETFHLSCWDEDLLSDDMIGRADVTLEFLLSKRGNKPFEIQIVDKDNFKKIAGYIGMTCEFEGSGAPPLESEKKNLKKKRPLLLQLRLPHQSPRLQIQLLLQLHLQLLFLLPLKAISKTISNNLKAINNNLKAISNNNLNLLINTVKSLLNNNL